jgi:uncharacterized protein DUF5691
MSTSDLKMQTWDDMLATAVVGTDQREFNLVDGEDELSRLLAQLSKTDREGFLLSAASLVALYRGAGIAPPVDAQPLPEACELDDDLGRVSARSGQHLAFMLEGEFREVLPEWLAAMKEARKRVPEEHLPALLAHGVLETSLREMIIAVLGRRGQWLAAQNPDWLYATRRDEKDVWETASRDERLLLLGRLRHTDPAQARELLATTWAQESAKDRVVFLEKFAIGSSASDEPFLNEALQDRSVEVRRVARTLLASLPSEFSRRLQALASQLLSFKKPLIGKARIEVTMPEDPIAWLKANGIEIDNPPRTATQSVGPKAWFLKELISLIPITHWSELWQKPPLEIVRAGDESEWRESFALGFVAAAQRDRDPDWIEALVAFTGSEPKQVPLLELVAYLPAARLEALSLRALGAETTGLSDGHPAFHLLLAHRGAWSDQLSRAVMLSIKKRISRGKDNIVDWQTKAVLKQFARFVSPGLYDELAAGWPTESDSWPNWAKGVDAFLSLLAFRRDLHQAITEKEQKP